MIGEVDMADKPFKKLTWKTAVMRITDAEFKQSSNFSSGDFGFSVTMDDQMYIKRVEIIQADLYD